MLKEELFSGRKKGNMLSGGMRTQRKIPHGSRGIDQDVARGGRGGRGGERGIKDTSSHG
jgi:hypothetical protein